MVTTPRNQVNFKDRMRSKPSWLKKSYTYFDIDAKKCERIVRSNTGEFLRWEKRRPNGNCTPIWYARFSCVLVPFPYLTIDTLKSLPPLPVGEKVVG